MKKVAAFISCLVFFQLLPVWAADLPELGDTAGADLSPWVEKKIGQKIANEIRWHDPAFLEDPDIEAYVNRVGGRLVEASGESGSGFSFFVINDATINAFATFGGFVGINTGLLLNVETESELAGVLAHEISHVTQRHLARQVSQGKSTSMATLAALAAALLVSHGNSQAGLAGVIGAQAGVIQSQLGYSRDFEREADRIGLQTLNKGGFNPGGMSGFFERLQRATRTQENNAPVYLRTHPLTIERIADMQNRQALLADRQVADSQEFHLVRAKLRAQQGTPPEAVKYFTDMLKGQKTLQVGAARYGLAVALLRAKDWGAANKALQEARQGIRHAMLERLAAQCRLAEGDVSGALHIFAKALESQPDNLALVYDHTEALITANRLPEALALTEKQLKKQPKNGYLWRLQAKTAAQMGKNSAKHRAQGELYAIQGNLIGAVEQLQLAQQANDGDFYDMSVLDARLREMQRLRAEEAEGRPRL